jgi:acyl carrier protein
LTTLSDVISEHQVDRIDLLKIDVEKSEFDVLSGLRAEDWAKVRQIVVEVDSRDLLDQLTALLEQHEFKFIVDEIVSVDREVAGADVHVYMLYAVRPNQEEVVDQSDLSASQLRVYLQRKLPGYMVPSAFTMLPALPLTPNGKVDLRALPESKEVAPVTSAYVAPETTTEQVITRIWCEVLKVQQVGVNDNFFEAGGTSLRLVEVNSKLREAFKRSIPVVEMFRHPTIRELAKYLEAATEVKRTFGHTEERASKRSEGMNKQRELALARKQKKSPAREAPSITG